MEKSKTIKELYLQTMKGKILGIFQVSIMPAIVLGILFYAFLHPFTATDKEVLLLIEVIFIATFGMLGYGMGAVYVSKRTLRKFFEKHKRVSV